MNIRKFDNYEPNEIDLLLSSTGCIESKEFDEEDSPISVDAMASIQNGKLMFVSSIKIGTLVGLLETEDPRLSIEQRRQRKPDLKRIPGMAEYLHNSPWTYSAITVALSGAFRFISTKRNDGTTSRLGILQIPRGYKSRNVIIDGQHRYLSLRSALGLESNFLRYALPFNKQKKLAEENIAVIFYTFKDGKEGIEWSQQYFHDLNCLGISASRSLGVKFDKRHPINRLTVRISERAMPFIGRIEYEERQCGSRNKNLFTLNALKNANKYLLDPVSENNIAEQYDNALLFWNSVGEIFQEWRELKGFEVRENYVHGYGVILSALGLLGKQLFQIPNDFNNYLIRLKTIDWSRWEKHSNEDIENSKIKKKSGNPFWHGFAMNGSTIQNTTKNIRNSYLLIKKSIGMKLEGQETYEYSQININ